MVERVRPEQLWIVTTGAAGPSTQEDENINKRSRLVGYVLEYRRFYGGGGGKTDGGWYVRSIPERTIYGTVRTGEWTPPCAERPRPNGLGIIPEDYSHKAYLYV